MPNAPRTPPKHEQAAIVTSPYFKVKLIPSPYFSGASCHEEKVGEDGFHPYNTYWDTVVGAARARPKLIQEEVSGDWWKVILATMLLNRTTGKAAIPVFYELMARWPDPASMVDAPLGLLAELLRPLGLYNIRAQRIIQLSVQYLAEPPSLDKPHKSRVRDYPPTAVSHLPGCGRYALDSFRIFCCPGDEWRSVMPTDKELIKYLRWKWAVVGRREWDPMLGVLVYDKKYLDSLYVLSAQA